MVLILTFLILCIPTAIELYGDRYGDLNKKEDIVYRVLFMAGCSLLVWLMTGVNGFISFNLSLAFFFLFFDYVIAYVLIRNGTLEPPRGVKYHWFRYTAKAGVIDNLKFWESLKPGMKLGIRIAYFSGSLWLFLIQKII